MKPKRRISDDFRLSNVVKRHPLIAYFVLAHTISWAFLPIEAVRFLPSGPLFAALIVIPITQGLAGLNELGSRMIRWRVPAPIEATTQFVMPSEAPRGSTPA
jgi:hypothetical protein